jgi:hypothetical protein
MPCGERRGDYPVLIGKFRNRVTSESVCRLTPALGLVRGSARDCRRDLLGLAIFEGGGGRLGGVAVARGMGPRFCVSEGIGGGGNVHQPGNQIKSM